MALHSHLPSPNGCGRFPRGALIQGGVIVHNDPFQKHEQRVVRGALILVC
jgi:hypothetical protein